MKSKIDKSLIEVWEMKDRAYKAFLLSGYSNYADFVKDSTKDIIKKYNLKYYRRRSTKEN
ncbi:MAG: hypothetical protein M1419_02230 [Bacteroidetes bacterium]|nr:hypothetical protein [Bacteroidota bacterium]